MALQIGYHRATPSTNVILSEAPPQNLQRCDPLPGAQSKDPPKGNRSRSGRHNLKRGAFLFPRRALRRRASNARIGDKIVPLRMQHCKDPTAEQKVLDKRYENAHSLP
ncbi:MAG: hypothetical protein WA891_05315 [Acidobacteriaceae bacterium]